MDKLRQVFYHQGADWIEINLSLNLWGLEWLLPDAMVLDLDLFDSETELSIVAVAEADDSLSGGNHLDPDQLDIKLLVVVP